MGLQEVFEVPDSDAESVVVDWSNGPRQKLLLKRGRLVEFRPPPGDDLSGCFHLFIVQDEKGHHLPTFKGILTRGCVYVSSPPATATLLEFRYTDGNQLCVTGTLIYNQYEAGRIGLAPLFGEVDGETELRARVRRKIAQGAPSVGRNIFIELADAWDKACAERDEAQAAAASSPLV